MKTGVILLFSDNEKDIGENQFQKLSQNSAITYCFINNASKDKTLETLINIKNKTQKNISILDIRKKKGLLASVKAGVRYLTSKQDLNSIIYFEFKKYNEFLKLESKFKIPTSNNLFKKIYERSILNNVFSLEQIINHN
ncbi:hypothetical protein H9W90_07225 [Polaribacter pectinis]|uniref:Glycosyltransferase 2-like domain-containing protein n=1 Tax=Polaribacter pectinis TaxID=2738844 RepID=A0A7G9LE44_9FLAO|nr:hypothetical protein [Polaribacter pectinis]QNM86893.1 hypothetical protein H9W90_07225 [Polaribacter pectinis]